MNRPFFPRKTALAGALSVACLSAPLVAIAQQAPKPAAQSAVPHIPVETFKLPNGLTVLLSVDHSA
ncbi:MAG: hypothetical protein ABJB74_03965, partial [Gemmatimonas sp.]